jgi:Predicted phosphatase/phosphohexomutase
MERIKGIGQITPGCGLDTLGTTADGRWIEGREGVKGIFAPRDRKIEIIAFEEKTLIHVKSAMGYPAIYSLDDADFEKPAEAVLMDLDGTSVHSEPFWIWIIEQTTARLLGNPRFELEQADIPFVSGFSVSEHLQYCINKYCPDKTVEEARRHYFAITEHEMDEILAGRGRPGAFTPAPGLKEFLTGLKVKGIKIGLVTSGLYKKAMPEILSAFRVLHMGDPADFYDAIITAGYPLGKGMVGTLGELAPKPHPWLYSETARVGLGIPYEKRNRVIGIEDSSAGIISIRLAGFYAVGIEGGNIDKSGIGPLENKRCCDLSRILDIL